MNFSEANFTVDDREVSEPVPFSSIPRHLCLNLQDLFMFIDCADQMTPETDYPRENT